MNRLLIILFCLLPVLSNAQDWKKYHATKTGDTLRAGDKVLLVKAVTYGFIYPKHHNEKMRMEAFRRYLQYTMTGNVFTIKRLSRVPITKKTFKGVAVIEVYDSLIDRMNPVEYYIEIDDALTNGEIEIVKPSHINK